jgi:hypothetical protein
VTWTTKLCHVALKAYAGAAAGDTGIMCFLLAAAAVQAHQRATHFPIAFAAVADKSPGTLAIHRGGVMVDLKWQRERAPHSLPDDREPPPLTTI